MPKSLLSTEEIVCLRQTDRKTLKEIAELAGTKSSGIFYRINPEISRNNWKNWYQSLTSDERITRRELTKQRLRDYQKLSLSQPVKKGEWTLAELDYLKEFGPTKTGIEVALDLKRTYASIVSAGHRYKIKLRK